MRRALSVMAAACLLVVATAAPASAHSVGGVEATNYRSEITAISPSVPGLTVRVREVGRKLEVTNHTGQDVVVLGYQDEPYLRVGPSGVFENRRAPSLYQDKAKPGQNTDLIELPPEADPLAAPDWRRRSGGRTVSWPDHRIRWTGADPPGVKANPGLAQNVLSRWSVAFLLGPARESVVVTGRISWIPGPPLTGWLLATVVLFAITLVAGLVAAWPGLLSGLLALLLAADMVRLYGAATASGGSVIGGLLEALLVGLLEVAAWGAGIWAVGAIQQRKATGLYLAMAVGLVLGFVSGVGDLLNLAYSQVPTGLPAGAARAAVAVCLGIGFGLVGGCFLALRRIGPLVPSMVTTAASRKARAPGNGSTP